MAKKLGYKELLTSDRRINMKKRRFKEAKNCCSLCGKKRGLVLHHLTYKNVGNERKKELVVICGQCHKLQHFNKGKRVPTYELPARYELTKKYFVLLRRNKNIG